MVNCNVFAPSPLNKDQLKPNIPLDFYSQLVSD